MQYRAAAQKQCPIGPDVLGEMKLGGASGPRRRLHPTDALIGEPGVGDGSAQPGLAHHRQRPMIVRLRKDRGNLVVEVARAIVVHAKDDRNADRLAAVGARQVVVPAQLAIEFDRRAGAGVRRPTGPPAGLGGQDLVSGDAGVRRVRRAPAKAPDRAPAPPRSAPAPAFAGPPACSDVPAAAGSRRGWRGGRALQDRPSRPRQTGRRPSACWRVGPRGRPGWEVRGPLCHRVRRRSHGRPGRAPGPPVRPGATAGVPKESV